MKNEIELFHVIPEAKAIVRTKSGVYKQADVFHRGADVYVKVGSGFAKVHGYGGTSVPTLHVDALQGDGIERAANGRPKFVAELA
jgi:hypothetical protein